jgi:hypothetical protein
VQELLGDHQDTVIARPVLREIAAAAHLDRENGFTYVLLHRRQTETTRLPDTDIDTAWRDRSAPIVEYETPAPSRPGPGAGFRALRRTGT